MTLDTNPMMDRRTLLTGAAALTAAGTLHPNSSQAQAVPNSVGTAQPQLKAPANACDCHHHIYDPARFPFAPGRRRLRMEDSEFPRDVRWWTPFGTLFVRVSDASFAGYTAWKHFDICCENLTLSKAKNIDYRQR